VKMAYVTGKSGPSTSQKSQILSGVVPTWAWAEAAGSGGCSLFLSGAGGPARGQRWLPSSLVTAAGL
jgi:hypothetical protein